MRPSWGTGNFKLLLEVSPREFDVLLQAALSPDADLVQGLLEWLGVPAIAFEANHPVPIIDLVTRPASLIKPQLRCTSSLSLQHWRA